MNTSHSSHRVSSSNQVSWVFKAQVEPQIKSNSTPNHDNSGPVYFMDSDFYKLRYYVSTRSNNPEAAALWLPSAHMKPVKAAGTDNGPTSRIDSTTAN